MGGDSQGEIERGAGVATLLALRATSPYAGGFGDGGTDCHGQCAHWPRNDIGFSWGCGVRRGTWALPYKGFRNIAGGQGRPPLRCCVTKKSVGEGLCPSRGRGNRRSAAGGGCSEPVSRKCPRFADATVAGNRLARRWAREPRPYGSATRGAMGGRPQGSPLRKRCKGCDAVRNPPGTASPCQPPLGKGALGTGIRIATGALRPRNDIGFSWGCGCGGAHGPRPTRAFAILRADRGVRPYGIA